MYGASQENNFSLMKNVGTNCIFGLSETWLDTKIDTDL